MSETIFTIPLAPEDYNMSQASIMVHNLSAPPNASTKIMTVPQFKTKLACNIIPFGTFLIFKYPSNTNEFTIETNDICQGWFSETIYFVKAIYLGGVITDINSWNILDSIEF